MPLENAVAEHLQRYHLGEALSVSSKELERTFQIRGPELRRIINQLRGSGVPICSYDYGYYYAETEQELLRTIRQLRSRIKKIAHAERGLTSALAGYVDTGQITFPLEDGDAP